MSVSGCWWTAGQLCLWPWLFPFPCRGKASGITERGGPSILCGEKSCIRMLTMRPPAANQPTVLCIVTEQLSESRQGHCSEGTEWCRELFGCSTDRSKTQVPSVVTSARTDTGWTHGRDLRVVRATWAKGGCQDTDSTLSMLCVVGRWDIGRCALWKAKTKAIL